MKLCHAYTLVYYTGLWELVKNGQIFAIISVYSCNQNGHSGIQFCFFINYIFSILKLEVG